MRLLLQSPSLFQRHFYFYPQYVCPADSKLNTSYPFNHLKTSFLFIGSVISLTLILYIFKLLIIVKIYLIFMTPSEIEHSGQES